MTKSARPRQPSRDEGRLVDDVGARAHRGDGRRVRRRRTRPAASAARSRRRRGPAPGAARGSAPRAGRPSRRRAPRAPRARAAASARPSATSSESVVRCGQARYADRSDGDRRIDPVSDSCIVLTSRRARRRALRHDSLAGPDRRPAGGRKRIRGHRIFRPNRFRTLQRPLQRGRIARRRVERAHDGAARPRLARSGTTRVASVSEGSAPRPDRAAAASQSGNPRRSGTRDRRSARARRDPPPAGQRSLHRPHAPIACRIPEAAARRVEEELSPASSFDASPRRYAGKAVRLSLRIHASGSRSLIGSR